MNLLQLPGDQLLRLALRADAAASGSLGLLSLVAFPLLDDLLGAPAALLVPVGAFLVLFAAALWIAAGRQGPPRTAGVIAVAVNVLWVIDSVVLVAAGWADLTALGVAFALVQAAAVAVFADLQFLGVRRVPRAV